MPPAWVRDGCATNRSYAAGSHEEHERPRSARRTRKTRRSTRRSSSCPSCPSWLTSTCRRSELVEQAGHNRVARVRPWPVAGEQHAEPIDARRAGGCREADGAIGVDHREVRDVQFLEEVAAAHAQLAGEV